VGGETLKRAQLEFPVAAHLAEPLAELLAELQQHLQQN